MKMIKPVNIQPQLVECYDNTDNFIGYLNEYEFNDLRCQIAEAHVSGYYSLFNSEKLFINADGRLDNWPTGFFDTIEGQLARLFKAQRPYIISCS